MLVMWLSTSSSGISSFANAGTKRGVRSMHEAAKLRLGLREGQRELVGRPELPPPAPHVGSQEDYVTTYTQIDDGGRSPVGFQDGSASMGCMAT